MADVLKSDGPSFNKLRWSLIGLLFIVIVIMIFVNNPWFNPLKPAVMTAGIFVIVVLHGIERYRLKDMCVFFVVTWIVSSFFEALSIRTGFPFSFYEYVRMPGPRLFDVPLIIMFAYFAMGYASWTLAHVLTGQYGRRLGGKQVFVVPLIATFIMVMWDLCMDPVTSNLAMLWVWRDPGAYFGVPLMNYFGWFMVVFIFFAAFALYISKYERADAARSAVFSGKPFWLEAAAVYVCMAMMTPGWASDRGFGDPVIQSMILVGVFTMLFVTILAAIVVINNRDLSWRPRGGAIASPAPLNIRQ